MTETELDPEQMMAACVMRAADETLTEAEGLLSPSMFEDLLCRDIWEVSTGLFTENKPVNLLTLRKHPKLKNRADDLRQIRAGFTTTAHLSHHIAQFVDLVSKRKLMEVARLIDNQIVTSPASQIIDSVIASITDIASDSATEERKTKDAKTVMLGAVASIEESQKRGGKIIGYRTGISRLDRAISGLQPGRLYIVAGRPAKGKSVLGVQIASYASRYEGVPAVMFSLEMTNDEIGQRLISTETGIHISEIMEGVDDGSGPTGLASQAAYSKINQAAAALAQTKLLFRDYPIMTALSLRVEVRRHVQKYGAKIFLIDYLQLFTTRGSAQDRRLAIGEITKTCKQLSKQYDVAIILISQLNREGDGKVNMSLNHLSDSDEIGRDADVVICLNDEQDIDVIKNRSGATGRIPMHFDGPTFKFTEADYNDRASSQTSN